jgi:hypothetical protein
MCLQYGSDAPTVRKTASTKFIMVKSQTTRQQSTRTTRQQWTNSPGMRGSKTRVEREAEREGKEEKEV